MRSFPPGDGPVHRISLAPLPTPGSPRMVPALREGESVETCPQVELRSVFRKHENPKSRTQSALALGFLETGNEKRRTFDHEKLRKEGHTGWTEGQSVE